MVTSRLLCIGSMLAVASALATAALIVVLRPTLARYALARPNARSSHRTPTPQGGGIAIMAVTIGAIFIALAVCAGLAPVGPISVVLAAAAALAIVGAADDILVLSALPRLLCQIIAAYAVLAVLPDGTRVLEFLPLAAERAVLTVALVWFVNLVNFMDGIDWITVAGVVPVTAGIATIAVLGEAPPIAFVFAVVIAGATLGFAPFNRPVARLFLGDVGSLPLGLLLGWLLVIVASQGHIVAAVLLPLYYVTDATLTLVRRLARGERVWEAHRTHFYQRATDRGYSVPAIVARVFIVNLVLAILAVASVNCSGASAQVALLVAGALAVAVLLRALARGPR